MLKVIVVHYSLCSQNINYIDNMPSATICKRIEKMQNTYIIVHRNIKRVFCVFQVFYFLFWYIEILLEIRNLLKKSKHSPNNLHLDWYMYVLKHLKCYAGLRRVPLAKWCPEWIIVVFCGINSKANATFPSE